MHRPGWRGWWRAAWRRMYTTGWRAWGCWPSLWTSGRRGGRAIRRHAPRACRDRHPDHGVKISTCLTMSEGCPRRATWSQATARRHHRPRPADRATVLARAAYAALNHRADPSVAGRRQTWLWWKSHPRSRSSRRRLRRAAGGRLADITRLGGDRRRPPLAAAHGGRAIPRNRLPAPWPAARRHAAAAGDDSAIPARPARGGDGQRGPPGRRPRADTGRRHPRSHQAFARDPPPCHRRSLHRHPSPNEAAVFLIPSKAASEGRGIAHRNAGDGGDGRSR